MCVCVCEGETCIYGVIMGESFGVVFLAKVALLRVSVLIDVFGAVCAV